LEHCPRWKPAGLRLGKRVACECVILRHTLTVRSLHAMPYWAWPGTLSLVETNGFETW